jgi:hypothetical protein
METVMKYITSLEVKQSDLPQQLRIKIDELLSASGKKDKKDKKHKKDKKDKKAKRDKKVKGKKSK